MTTSSTQRDLLVLERDVLALLAENTAVDEVLGMLARGLERITNSGQLASVLRIVDDRISHIASPSLPIEWCARIEGEPIGPQAGSCGTAAFRKERVIVTDIETDPLWDRYRDLARPFGLRACWSHPICATDGEVLGTVALYFRQPRGPTDLELEAIEGIARVARIALERHRDELSRERLLAELRESLRYNEMLIGIVGHDLRNPLQAITVGAELALHRELESAKRPTLERIYSSATRMGRMIGQILDLTRARQHGSLSVSPEPIDLASVARDVAAEIQLVYREPALQVSCSGDTRGLWDGDRVSQALTNLLGNAMQHGDRSRHVELAVTGVDDQVTVVVHNGGSIPADHLEWLFDPFRRASARAAGAQGLGLGLFITKQIVLAHRGTIDVQSSAVEGTRFEIVLPRTPATAPV